MLVADEVVDPQLPLILLKPSIVRLLAVILIPLARLAMTPVILRLPVTEVDVTSDFVPEPERLRFLYVLARTAWFPE